jgi:CBS domain containing-hemolysin-like protein
MRELTLEDLIEMLVVEFQAEGHEVIEAETVHYARIEHSSETGAITASEVNLTRLADAIIRRVS